ncbi:MAG: ATP-binding protein [Acidobacteriia bacterium]|nr:ATP-binding protein [Terriglobia bacterium]
MPRVAWWRLRYVAAAVLLLPRLTASDAWSLERLQRKFDLEQGLPFSEINSIAQDTRGFLWITAGGGLFRYDGVELRAWARGPERRYIKDVATGPAGEVLVREGPGDSGGLYEVADGEIRAVAGPEPSPWAISGAPVWDGHSNLWVTTGERVWFKPPRGGWREVPPSLLGSERPYELEVSEDGAAIVITEKAIWRADTAPSTARLASIGSVQRVLARADGSLVILAFNRRGSQVSELRDGRVRELFDLRARPIDMVQRGRTLWVAYDSCLVALRPGEPPEILGPAEGVPSGGPLLVDHEGSLWLASFRGLLQYPEPDTVAWLGDHATRRLELGPEGIWVDSWGGLTLLRRQGASWRPEPSPDTGTSAVCVGTDGTMWAGYAGRFLERRGGRFVSHSRPDLTNVESCSPGADGRVWLSTNLGLMLADGSLPFSRPAPRTGPPRIATKDVRANLLEDRSGRLWVTANDEICHADARAVASGRPVGWSCSRAAGAGSITSLVEIASGNLWAATALAGVYRRTSHGWEPIPGSRMLPTPLVRKLRPSPSGGAWIISFGTILRVVDRPGSEEGWEIVERPAPWHGLMISDAEDILEEVSGDLWITTLAGVVHIGAEVRRAVPPVPRVELVDVLLDGKPLAWQGSVALPYRRNRIELRFAALSYRDPSRLRYQVRLRGESSWLDSRRPSFQFVDLPPGRYQAEVRASLDGRRWSAAPASLSFAVLPPFWRSWWFALIVVAVVASGAYALYRYRVAQLLRVERMRTRIALDLHDDVGSSLSQIALQSDLALSRIERGEGDATSALEQISASSRGLVDTMSDVVWAVDPSHDILSDLARRIRSFALESEGAEGLSILLDLPPPEQEVPLDANVRRQVFLIFKETFTNSLRHAAASRIEVRLCVKGDAVELVIADDGHGFSVADAHGVAGAERRGGQGLGSMQGRAASCNGTLVVESAPGRGTTVTLRVPLR